MPNIVTALYTFFHGKSVGTDVFGNRYYVARKQKSAKGHKKRWVVYKGVAEASKVPAEWHGWLHYTSDILPSVNAAKQPWQKEHIPNLTGTAGAYAPSGHIGSGSPRAKSAADYDAWTPNA